ETDPWLFHRSTRARLPGTGRLVRRVRSVVCFSARSDMAESRLRPRGHVPGSRQQPELVGVVVRVPGRTDYLSEPAGCRTLVESVLPRHVSGIQFPRPPSLSADELLALLRLR